MLIGCWVVSGVPMLCPLWGAHSMQVGVHIDFARIEFPQRQIVLQVYDTAGEERYRAHSRSFYRGAQCAILVYDVTRHDTFLQLQSFHDEVRHFPAQFPPF